MKRFIIPLLLVFFTLPTQAQKEKANVVKIDGKTVADYKISGYVMMKYNYTGKEGVTSDNGFGVRIARATVSGMILDQFKYILQYQFSTNVLVDANVEWQKYKFFRVKIGQFKRCFTFENPMNPIDQGFYSYGQNVLSLSGFNDRTGEHSSNGRDEGVQIQGDLLPNSKGRPLFHYQAGIYNGQGINSSDVNSKKDYIGGLWVMPLAGMRIGVFGWTGSYAEASGGVVSEAKRNRYALSGEYQINDWTLRSEYIHSQGRSLSDETLGDKADGWYALCIAPIIKKKIHVKARYQSYRQNAAWADSYNQFEAGADYSPHKNITFDLEYNHSNDRRLEKHDYDMLTAQMSFRF